MKHSGTSENMNNYVKYEKNMKYDNLENMKRFFWKGG